MMAISTEPANKPARLTDGQVRVLVRIALGLYDLPRKRRAQTRILWVLESFVLSKRAKEPALIARDPESYRYRVTEAGHAKLAALGVRVERVALGMLEYADPDEPLLTPYAQAFITKQIESGRWTIGVRTTDGIVPRYRQGARFFRVTEEGRAYWKGLWA